MTRRHPLVILAACWLAVGLLFVAADCLLKPTPNPTPAPATRLPLTVLPTATTFVFAPRSPEPPVIIEALPMLTSTLLPSATPTIAPTATPVPPQKTMVQRG